MNCFSVSDGKKIWEFKSEFELIKSQKKLSIVFDEQDVYFNNSTGNLYSLNKDNGNLVWVTPTKDTDNFFESFLFKTSKILLDNDQLFFSNNQNSFFSLDKKIVGESHLKKIVRVSKFLKKNKSDYLFVTAPENVAWLLNIRGFDNPNSPIPNCRLLINSKGKFYIITDKTP